MAEPIESTRDQSGALELGEVSPTPLAQAPYERVYKRGSAGEEIGDEPYAVIFHSDAPGRYGLATNVEGDWMEEIYATQEERDVATDEQAFWYWKTQEQAWVEGIETLAELPAEYRGTAIINTDDQPTLPIEVNRERRGMPFLPKRKLLAQIPALHSQDEIDRADHTVYLHYFGGPYDFYLDEIGMSTEPAVLRFEPEAARELGRGLFRSHLNGEYRDEWDTYELSMIEEFTYSQKISINESAPMFVDLPLERDLYWEPKTFRQLGLVKGEVSGQEVTL